MPVTKLSRQGTYVGPTMRRQGSNIGIDVSSQCGCDYIRKSHKSQWREVCMRCK